MSRLPTAVIPVTVDTRDVDAGVRHIQHKMAGLQKKLAKMQPAGALGGGLKASQGTAFLGGVGKLGPAAGLLGGMGAGGMAAAAPAALAMMARGHVEAMAALTKGATDALNQFKRTGEQTFAINSEVLARLADAERGAQAAARVPGYREAFQIGMTGPDQGGAGTLEQISTFMSQASAAAGAFLGGKSLEEAALAAQLVTATEAQAKAIGEELRRLEQERMRGETSALSSALGNFNLRIEQLAILLGKVGV